MAKYKLWLDGSTELIVARNNFKILQYKYIKGSFIF